MTALRPCLAAAAVLVTALSAAAQDADSAVTLRRNVSKGDRWSIDEDLQVTVALALTAKGKAAQTISQTNHRVRKGELTVLKAADGQPDSVRVQYGAECLDTEQVGDGEVAKNPTALAGQKVNVKRRDKGEPVVTAEAGLADADRQEARALLDAGAGLLPKDPVKIGDRWTADERALPASLVALFSLAPGDTCKVRLRLKELHDVEGRRVAAIEVKVTVDEKRDSSTSKFELAGTIALDAGNGVALAVELHGTMTASGSVEQEGEDGKAVKVAIEGKGDIRYRGGVGTFAAAPAAGATAFGHMRFTPPAGWTSTVYANGVVVHPGDLPAGGHLDITVMQAMDWAGTLDDALKKSWEDAAQQLGLGTTTTVDGTPYMKRQSGTSFRGWEYLRADGALRSADGDYETHLMLVKIKGRVERIVVVSKERSWRGDSSCYSAPPYYDAIQAFLFSVQFDYWTDAVVAPATLKGDGIVGVWTGLTMTSGTIGGEYAIFFANGQSYFASKFPIHGLDGFDTWVDREMRPRYWGTWEFRDGAGTMKLIYQEVPLRSAADVLVLTTLKTDHKYVKLDAPDGARFDGTWAFEGEPGKPKAAITFTPGGEFRDAGAVNILNHGYPLVEAPGDGTYEVRNYTLLLHFKDGREYRIAYPGVGYEKGNSRPQKLILSFNEDALIRQ